MARASAKVEIDVPASAAEALWYDTSRWPVFVDGFGHLIKVEGDWPHLGARVVWDSRPEGRGRVTERVVAYEVRRGQTVEFEDPRSRGTQEVTFTPRRDACTVTLELRYELKSGGIFAPLIDLVFVRRVVTDGLRRTLARFQREAVADAELTASG